MTKHSLTPAQSVAVSKLLDFIQDPNPSSRFFTFAGYAGTGKTFCMKEVVDRCAGSHVKFAFTAPTNKAAKVLASITGEACTIFSLLGLRIDKTGELKQLIAGKAPNDLSDLDVVFVDEASMVNSHLHKLLREKADQYDLKVVFLGDKAQLPPVGEAASPIWGSGPDVSLTEVVRHDNQILDLVTAVRGVVGHPAPCINLKSHNDGSEGVWKLSKQAFKQSIYDSALNGGFADGSKSKVIAWRNARVSEYNDLIRQAIFGAIAVPGMYLVGDRIVAAAPCVRADDTLMTTDEEGLVEGVIECKHPIEPKYQAIELKVRTELNKLVRLLVLHPASAQQFENDSQSLAHLARENGRLWKKFWEHKDLFHDIKYAYALTAHRAQGSTYENVWVDSQDILLNRNRLEAFQCFYTACSRPTTRLYLA